MPLAKIQTLLTWLAAGIGVACLACLAISFAWSPEEIAAGAPVRAIGLTPGRCPGCPLCGLSRGFALFGEGRVREAASLNRSVLVLYPLFWIVGVGGVALAIARARKKRLKPRSSR